MDRSLRLRESYDVKQTRSRGKSGASGPLVAKVLPRAGIAGIDIERYPNNIHVTINTSKPGIVIGRKGASVKEVRRQIEELTGTKIKLDIRPTPDSASFQRSIAARDYQMMQYNIYEALDPRLVAVNWKTKGSRNYSSYSNPQVDQLVDKSFGQPLKEALVTIGQIEKILFDALPLIVPNGSYENIAANNRVKGLADRLGPGSGGQYNETSKARKFIWVEG